MFLFCCALEPKELGALKFYYEIAPPACAHRDVQGVDLGEGAKGYAASGLLAQRWVVALGTRDDRCSVPGPLLRYFISFSFSAWYLSPSQLFVIIYFTVI